MTTKTRKQRISAVSPAQKQEYTKLMVEDIATQHGYTVKQIIDICV